MREAFFIFGLVGLLFGAMPVSITGKNDTNTVSVTSNGSLQMSSLSHVDAGNSTSTPLDSGDTFVGVITEILEEAIISISVFADKASATDGLIIEFSTDSVNFDNSDVYTISASTGEIYTIQPAAQYYRVRYINGDTTQTAFRLQTIFHHNYIKPSSHRVADQISNQDDAELVKSVITGQNGNGQFHNVKTTADGNLTISDNSSGLSIAQGNVTGLSFIHKFGNAPDFDAADNMVTIWDGADDGDINQMTYVYSSTPNITKVSSSSSSDAFDVEIQGLGSDCTIVLDTVTLNGQNKVTLNQTYFRVFRMKNIGSVDNVGHVYCYVDTTITAGVPDSSKAVRAIMQPGNNQTLMAVYTIPKNTTSYMRDWYASVSGASKSSNYTIELRARPIGGVFQVKHVSAISDAGTSAYKHGYTEPEVFGALTDIELKVQALAGGVTAASVSGGFDIVLEAK